MAAVVEWGDGRRDAAPTWDALLEILRAKQWHGMSDEGFRIEMAKRALRWSGTKIDPWLPARKLFGEFERARMLIVVTEEE